MVKELGECPEVVHGGELQHMSAKYLITFEY